MRDSEILKRTTNNAVYRKLYKKQLEQRGKIRCSICAVHRGENDERKCYGTTRSWHDEKYQRTRYPSWKLVSKNKNQYTPKPLKFRLNGIIEW